MLIRRRVQRPPEDASLNLLTDLLEAPTAESRIRPVALRSVAEQRRTVLAPYPLRTWFDKALTIGERCLGIVVIGFFCWWAIDGYGRDWWYAYTNPTPVVAQPKRAAVQAPPQSAAAKPRYPEMGRSLPVVDERWSRPGVTLDYLAPARIFVAPLPPKPTPQPEPAKIVDLRPTQLTIPAIQIDSKIVEVFLQDGAWQVADYAVGYHHGTGMVGTSNMVLAGHKGVRGAVFRALEQLKPGDDIFVDAAGERYQYRVRVTGNVWPNQVDVMYPTEQAQLTLLTCTNWDTQRFIVVADFVGPLSAPKVAGGN